MRRTYMLAAAGPDKAGNREILQFTDEENREVYAVVPDNVAIDVLTAIRRAYSDGRRDQEART